MGCTLLVNTSMGALCCHYEHLDDSLLSLPRTSAMDSNVDLLNAAAPLAAVSTSVRISSSSLPIDSKMERYISQPKSKYDTSHSRALIGEHWRKTSNGTFIPLSLLELSVRSICATMLVLNHDALQATLVPPEVAAIMIAWLRQHYVLEKPQFQSLVPYLLFEWNLANVQEVEDSWFNDVPATKLQSVKSIDVSGCTQLQQFGSKWGNHVYKLPELVVASFKKCTQLSWKVIEMLQYSTKLTALDLSGCLNVDDKCLKIIKVLVHLTSLQLIGCYQVTNLGIEHLLPLKYLEKLRLGRCRKLTDEAFDRFATSFSKLRELDVAYCRLSNVAMEHIGRIESLQVLTIRGCPIITDDGVAALAGLTNLIKFDARHCSLIRWVPAEWTQLQVLLIGYTAFDETNVTILQNLTKLQEIELHKCHIKKRGFDIISRLPCLERLMLEDTDLSDSSLLKICNEAKDLTALNVSDTEVSDSGATGLAKLTKLRILRLDTSKITCKALANLSILTHLEYLDLFGANISDIGLMHLIPLRNLQELTVCGGNISDRGVGFISKVTSLTSLNLSQNTNIRTKSVIYLQALTGLRCLNLSNTGISAASLCHLSPLRNLQSLSVYGCLLSRDHIEGLKEMLPELTVLRCT
ncbi:Leucine rich repeat proteins, some proteins contain F-box [Plasmopara halstedii]|uniref:Leucine rich repeat proteins, some proteins contain F-box n=1 Tax=Plasmopara halstedii TaxID=4781 RepID=A0A0P1AKK4_PLAHL|nr:Leucine rich repeat proteins, some proteins contain F-box [Plasmopara halstedii]CEG41554.1 Leucine rich repeat proteins, some proteins contain F-box [Plasmopara halstedii]|eukprot:XP_024577923.1 Leucine rich repeat proteins, some proteins contain F-box [Plasmopara halstedii]